jgi:hypothetical protein
MYSVKLWELACLRWRPASRPVSTECTRSNCGSWLAREDGLPAGLIFPTMLNSKCGSEPARESGLTADLFLPNVLGQIVGAGLPAMAACQPTKSSQMYPTQLWERACSRRRPDSRPVSSECTRSNCGSWLACDGGLPANQSLTDVPDSIVGASLLAMTDLQSTMFIAKANHSDHSHKTFSLPVGSTISSLCLSLPIQ